MNMIDHIRRSMNGEPSPPKQVNEVKDAAKPVIRKAVVSSIDEKIKALIEAKRIDEVSVSSMNSKETAGAPIPTDNFIAKGKPKPTQKGPPQNGNAKNDGQDVVELGGVTPVDLEPETKDVTTKDLRKEFILHGLLAPSHIPKSSSGKTISGGLKAGGKYIGKAVGGYVANEIGKSVGIKGSTITGVLGAFASGGKSKITAKKRGDKAATPKMQASTPNAPNIPPHNNPNPGKSKRSGKSPNVKGAKPGTGGAKERMSPDEYRKEAGLSPRESKPKPGTPPESTTSKGASSFLKKETLFKKTSSDNEGPAHQPATNHNSPMANQNKSASSSNRLSSKLNSRLKSSTSMSSSNNPMSAKSSITSHEKPGYYGQKLNAQFPINKSPGKVSSLEKFKSANKMKMKKISEELSRLVRMVESKNRFTQPPSMEDLSADQHLDAMLQHHNTGLKAKAAGDKTGAKIHFLTRNHHFAWYHRKAPDEHSSNMDLAQVRAMLDVKEDENSPLDKVMAVRKRLIHEHA